MFKLVGAPRGDDERLGAVFFPAREPPLTRISELNLGRNTKRTVEKNRDKNLGDNEHLHVRHRISVRNFGTNVPALR